MCVCAQVCACVCVCVYACRRVVCAYVHTTCPILGLQELSSESSFVYIFYSQLYVEKGKWGSRLAPGSRTQISVRVHMSHFIDVLTAQECNNGF